MGIAANGLHMGQDGDDEALVGRYYRSLDQGAYTALEAILAPEFTQYRPDRIIRGRAAFIRFMREERPRHDTIHRTESIFRAVEPERAIAVEGRLMSEADECLFGFVDVVEIHDEALHSIRTYTR